MPRAIRFTWIYFALGCCLTLAALTLHRTAQTGASGLLFFPAAAGRWWYYRTQSTILGERREQRLLFANAQLERRGSIARLTQQRQLRHLALFQIDKHGVARIGPPHTALAGVNRLLPQNLRRGEKWTSMTRLGFIESRTFAQEDRLTNRAIDVALENTIVRTNATVDTPAGRFSNCLQIDSEGETVVRTDRGNHYAQVKIIESSWYAPSVGLVKIARAEKSDSSFLGEGRYEQLLLQYGQP